MDLHLGRYLYPLYILSGILLGVGFVWTDTWLLVFIGVGLFIFAISKTNSYKKALVGGFIAWTTKYLFAISWFWSTYPIEWIDLPLGKSEALVVGIYWLTVSMFLGLGGAMLSLLWSQSRKYFLPIYGILIFPSLLVLCEIFGSFMFSVWTTGAGSTFNTVFSFGYLGFLLGYNEVFLQLASFGGVYLLSWVVAFIGYLGLLIYTYLPRQKALLIISSLALLMFFSGGDYLFSSKINSSLGEIPTTVAIVDTQFGGDWFKKEDKDLYKYKQISEAVFAALALNPDYIVLPEDSRFTSPEMTPELSYRMFRFQTSDTSSILIDSGRVSLAKNESVLRATIYDGVSKNGWIADKQYLVPQGEFMPYFYINSLGLLGMDKAVEEVSKKLTYRQGPVKSQSHFPEVVPAVLFCFESADPNGVRRLMKERNVPFVAHPVSHAWFHESKILWQQQDIMLKVQAIWNNIPIVSAGNMAKGALYTKDGKKIQPTLVKTGESWQVSLVSW